MSGGHGEAVGENWCSGDTSFHDWLESRGRKLYLVLMIDDATSRAYGQMVGADSTGVNPRVLWGYLERWGRPVDFTRTRAACFG